MVFLLLVFLAGGVGMFFYLFSESTSNSEQVARRYFKPYSDYWTNRDTLIADSEYFARVTIAMEYYRKGHFQSAIDAFQKFEPLPVDDGYYNLYLGISYLESDFTNLGINHLYVASISFNDFTNIYLSKWYLALAYLRNNRIEEGEKMLNQVIGANSSYKKRAIELKKELKL